MWTRLITRFAIVGLILAGTKAAADNYPLTSPHVYRGANLQHVAMPIGGIGTGTIWLDGQGRLAVWQIFNRYDENRVPDSFFAVRAQAHGGTPIVRTLQTTAEDSLQPMTALSFEGGYPIARLNFEDPALPVQVQMEAFNPFIPTNADDSSIPCAIFRLTARNPGNTPVDVTFLGTLRNAAGGPGGQSRNRILSAGDATMLAMDKGSELPKSSDHSGSHPDWGSLALTLIGQGGKALSGWTKNEELAAFISGTTSRTNEALAAPGATLNGALDMPFTLQPGESRTVSFVLAWNFPNFHFSAISMLPKVVYQPSPPFDHSINRYSRRWPDAAGVARYVVDHLDSLWTQTLLYHDTVYQSNLPPEFLDAMTSQSVILRSPTCFWTADGYFGGYEGSYACWPLNCTHVWNYAQTHARLFPEIGRNMRVSDFITFLHPDGEIPHRQLWPGYSFIPSTWSQAYADGQCASIEAAYREYQLSPDRKFLEQIWPGVKKAMDWTIAKYDSGHTGVTGGEQWDTYDTAVSGANTYIGSQYLCALAASERMALAMNDPASAQRWRTLREAGMKTQNERLWGGEYYIQIPGTPPGSDYNDGCLADQLLGQWWAHMLDLGYLYPPERVRAALQAVMKYNYGTAGLRNKYGTTGLQNCTWPKKDPPKPPINYAVGNWTGIEYATASAMVYEGLVDDAQRIVKTALSRYDGSNNNPFEEIESGNFYARAMSSWGLLIASQGLVLDGPAGILGFKPNWHPENHRSFFTAPEGWGLFIQTRNANQQLDRIEVRYGKIKLRQLIFAVPENWGTPVATVKANGNLINAKLQMKGGEARLLLGQVVTVPEGGTVEVMLQGK